MIELYIIVPCYNGERFIDKCLNSIEQFQLLNNHINVECIFVDDGSIDNTKYVVDNFLKRKDINLKYLFKENGGLCSARNYGLDYINDIQKSDNSFVLLLDVDDIICPIKIDIDKKIDNHIFYFQVEKKIYKKKDVDIGKLSQFNPFVVSSILFRFNEVRFDEELTSLEDWDFWINRFIVRKETYTFINKSITRISKTEGSMSTNKERMLLNRVKVAKKYLNNEAINKQDRINFEINFLFKSLKYKDIHNAFIIAFPYINRRNLIVLIKEYFLKQINRIFNV